MDDAEYQKLDRIMAETQGSKTEQQEAGTGISAIVYTTAGEEVSLTECFLGVGYIPNYPVIP